MNIDNYVEKLIDGSVKTPAYIFNCIELKEHVDIIKDIAGKNIGLCYAMKANPLLVKVMDKLVGKVEVCSPGELEICKKSNISPQHIIFSGVNKTSEDIEHAFLYGVGVITIESYKHFVLIREYCINHKCEADVYLRLSDGMQFGLDEETLEKIVKDRENYEFIHIKGIHYFSGTQKKNIQVNIDEIDRLTLYIKKLKDQYGLHIECLEYGVGLYVQYFMNESFDNRYSNLKEIVQYIAELNISYKIVLEVGRYFVAGCGTYVTKVDDVKSINEQYFCIVDGGIHHLNYYGQNYAMRTPIIKKINYKMLGLPKADNIDYNNKKWNVCGSLCTYADILARNVLFDSLNIGDVLVFENTGAYSITESPSLFLSRNTPYVYMNDEKMGLKIVRNEIITAHLNYVLPTT